MHSCMMARDDNCEMPRYDVAEWESALDLSHPGPLIQRQPPYDRASAI